MFLCVALLLSPTLTYAPQTSAPQVRVQSPSLATADQVELLGVWPYGPCQAVAIDPARNIALIGNGEALQVLDMTNKASLSRIGEIRLPGNPQGIALAGDYAYVVTLSYLVVIDISDPKNPSAVTGILFAEFSFYSIAISSGRIYLAYDHGLLIYDVSNPRQPVYRATYGTYGFRVVDIALWGKYALCAYEYWKYPEHPVTSYGVDVVDVSSPAAPVLTGTFDLGRDYRPRGIEVSALGHVYVCQSTERYDSGRLTVIDVGADPGHPAEVGHYARAQVGFEAIALAGNYAVLFQQWPCLLITLNVSNPSSPAVVGESWAPCGCADIVSSGILVGTAHGGDGFSLYGVANPSAPSRLANYDTPDTVSDYTSGNGVVVRGDYVYLACNSDGLRTMDVSVPSNPQAASLVNFQSQSRVLTVSRGYVYGVDSSDRIRLSIFELSSPGNPSRVAGLDLPCPAPASDSYDYWGIAVRMPYAYVSGTNWGGNPQRAILLVIDVSDPYAPRLVGSFVSAYKAVCVGAPALSGNYLYLGLHDNSQGDDDRRASLRVIDISDPRNPREVQANLSTLTGSYGMNVVVRGNYAYFTGDMLRIYDVSNPQSPRHLVSYVLFCDGIALSGDYVYLNRNKLWIIDISDIYHPTGVYLLGERAKGVAVSGNIAHVPGSLAVFKNKMAPDVAITSPTGESTLLGSVSIEVQASHGSGIDRVDIYIDESLKTSDTSVPYSYTWDTRSYDDGFHTIRVRAYNGNGKSADLEREVFTRLVYAPLDFKGEKILNRSLSQAEYINVLTWRANPNNVNIAKYRLYQLEGKNRSQLAELGADTFQYWHRRVEKDKSYTYALIAVNTAGRESDPVSVTVR